MEAFSLLKYWRGGGGGIGDVGPNSKTVATIVTTVDSSTTTEEIRNDDDDDDEGPFFDLEFSLDEDDEEDDDNKSTKSESEEEEENREFNFTLSSEASNDRTDELSPLSPSDDLFFKGKLVPIEGHSDSDHTNSTKFPVSSLLKSATKFRVFMLGLKKSSEKTESNVDSVPAKKFFAVKFKVEEVPIVSLLARGNSSKVSNKPTKQSSDINEGTTTMNSNSSSSSSSEEKRFPKEVMQKYLRKVKPLYVQVSRRYGENKLRLASHVSVDASPAKPVAPESAAAEGNRRGKGGGLNFPAGLRVVCKHLGKSKSASSAVVAAAPAPAPPPGTAASRRRDDSLIQQQDGIQSAILHCKKSFNSEARDSEYCLLSRCASDPCNEKKGLDSSRKSSDGIQRP